MATRAGEALSARGHAPQVVPQADSVSLFRLDGTRKPIRIQGDGFVAGDQTFSATALAEEASSAPEHFSPNVLLRPLAQDTLFPTICYVAGPSELAYLGQLGEVYRHFSLPMPLIHPRATATLVDSATARFLQKYDVPFEDLQPQDEAALNRLLQAQLPPTVEASLTEAEEAIRRSMERAVSAVSSVDPTLAGAAKDDAGENGTRAQGAARQGDPGRETPRRDLAPPVHPRAGPDVPARPPAGAHASVSSIS